MDGGHSSGQTASGEPKWIGQIIEKMWDDTHLRWKARNAQLHQDMQDRGYNATKKNLIAQINAVYQHAPTMYEQDKFPFAKALAEWETAPVLKMTSSLCTNVPFVNYCRKVSLTPKDSQTNDMRRFTIGTSMSIIQQSRPTRQ
eukprot:1472815-Ditylum_brightwellii.AAC.1